MDLFDQDNGVNFPDLPVGTKIEAETRNTRYTFIITSEGLTVDDGGKRCVNGPAKTRIAWNIVRPGWSMWFDHPVKEGKSTMTTDVRHIVVTLPDGTTAERSA